MTVRENKMGNALSVNNFYQEKIINVVLAMTVHAKCGWVYYFELTDSPDTLWVLLHPGV